MGNLYTIGHSTMEVEDFIALLQQHNVNYVVDVRSTPFSKYASQFNKENLKESLKSESIDYAHMGQYFGARQIEKPDLFTNAQLDFEKVRESDNFLDGFNSILRGLDKGNNIAFMCTEKDPIMCHRTIMVSRAFELSGIKVMHILSDGSLESQESINDRLLEKFFPNRDQISLFSNSIDNNELLKRAYRLQNKEIGFKMGLDSFEG